MLIGESFLECISPFRINVLGTARSSVENKNRGKLPGQYDQINQQRLPTCASFKEEEGRNVRKSAEKGATASGVCAGAK